MPQVGPFQYFVDPSNSTGKAVDTNPGTAAAPFLTTEPLEERLAYRNLIGESTVTVLSDFPPRSPTWALRATVGKGGLLRIKGTVKMLHTGTFTAATPPTSTAGACALATATDPSGFDFTPFVGEAFILITSGPAAGATAPLRGAPSAGVATLGSLGIATPATGNLGNLPVTPPADYQLLQPTRLPQVAWDVNGLYGGLGDSNQGGFNVEDVWIEDDINAASSVAGTVYAQFARCMFGSTVFSGTSGNWVNCIFLKNTNSFIFSGGWSAFGGVLYGATMNVEAGGQWTSDDCGIDANGSLAIGAGGVGFLLSVDAYHCETPFIVVGELRFVGVGHFWWGADISTAVASVYAGGSLIVTPVGDIITIASSGPSDVLLDGLSSSTYVRSDDGAFISTPLPLTFANLAKVNSDGGFGWSVTSSISGARVVRSVTE